MWFVVYRYMAWFLSFFFTFCALAQAEPCTQPEDCGISSAAIPDYSLTDMNPNSPTYGTTISRSDQLGEVMVIYFSSAT